MMSLGNWWCPGGLGHRLQFFAPGGLCGAAQAGGRIGEVAGQRSVSMASVW